MDPVETLDYLYGLEAGHEHVVEIAKGVRLFIGLEAISGADTKGYRTVMTTLYGQLRPILVRDRKIAVNVVSAIKANLQDPAEVAAPFAGVVTLLVGEGALVEPGQPVATIEAMKMEASITANLAGKVSKIAISKTQSVESGDLILIVSPN